jgi:CBS domain-containing protein
MTLREALHSHIPSLTRSSTLRDAVDKMDIYQFPSLVVVDEDRRPVGVLTEGDVCRAVGQNGSLLALAEEPAAKFASLDPITAHPDMDVGDALHLMLSRGVTLLPVIEDEKLSGIVLRIDLMQAVLMDAKERA